MAETTDELVRSGCRPLGYQSRIPMVASAGWVIEQIEYANLGAEETRTLPIYLEKPPEDGG